MQVSVSYNHIYVRNSTCVPVLCLPKNNDRYENQLLDQHLHLGLQSRQQAEVFFKNFLWNGIRYVHQAFYLGKRRVAVQTHEAKNGSLEWKQKLQDCKGRNIRGIKT